MAETAPHLSAETAQAGAAAAPASTEAPRWLGLTLRQLAGPLAVVALVQVPFLVYFARGAAPVTASVPFADDFERAELGPNWWSTGGHWRLEGGWLHSPGVKNNPLWLEARLPDDAAVEFDARSESAEGDIKCEVFGNGYDHASGYVVIFGGWSNTTSIIARLDEHGRDRKETHGLKVEKGRTYHFRLERKGSTLRWWLDGQLALELDDRAPLRGRGHDRFGFSSWDADLYFDNLKVTPL